MHTKKFYTCKWDRPFKEILLKEENRDILQKILETSLKIKVYEIKELNVEKRVGNLNVKGKRVDILLFTEIGYIGIELNARYQEYLHVRNLAYHCDNYAHYTLRGEEYKCLIMLDLGLEELEKIAKKDKMVEKYMEEIEKLNESPEFHIYMTEEEDRRKCFNTKVSIAKEKAVGKLH